MTQRELNNLKDVLIFKDKQFEEKPFDSEAELEKVVVDYYEFIFGANTIYLPSKLITVPGDHGSIPDGFVIDIESGDWYIVEAELISHSVSKHIGPQVLTQLTASDDPKTISKLIDLAITQYKNNASTKEKFDNLNILEVQVHGFIHNILKSPPIVGIPINGTTLALTKWATHIKNRVIIWVVSKYVEFGNPTNIVYKFPKDNRPILDTIKQSGPEKANTKSAMYGIELSDLIEANLLTVGDKLSMLYKPNNGQPHPYNAKVLEGGLLYVLELEQQFSSPSYAALAGIKNAGSPRKTVNGWTSWKNSKDETLADLRDKLLSTTATL